MGMGAKRFYLIIAAFCVAGLLTSCAGGKGKRAADADEQGSDVVAQDPATGTSLPEWNPDEQAVTEGDLMRPPVGEPVEIAELQTVYFDYDQFSLRPDALATLQANLDWFRANPGKQVLIEGHCDERGTEEYNLSLGDKRAKEVMGYLLNANVAEGRIFTISYGEAQPEDLGHDEAAWSKNRRAVFKVYNP